MMSLRDQLRRQGIPEHMIATALVDGKPLAEAEKQLAKPDDGMNKLERHYSWFLDGLVKDGVVIRYRFGQVKLRLADRTWYTIDFQVWLWDGRIAMVETKGWCRDDAAVKFKVAREMYPEYLFTMVRRKKAWEIVMGEKLVELLP